MAYVFEHEGRQFSPDGEVKVDDIDAHNKAIEAEELARWETKPERWQCYVTDKGAVTWLGTSLGKIVKRSTFRNNLDKRITAITIRGTNGATYYGRYGADWSQLCRIRKTKG